MSHAKLTYIAVGFCVSLSLSAAVAGVTRALPQRDAGAVPLTSSDGVPVVTEAKAGLVTAEVDVGACASAPEPCPPWAPGAAARGNAVPVRIVVQVSAIGSVGALEPGDIEVRVQFAPEGAPAIEPLTCATCFERRDGDTYGLWIGPMGGTWVAGAYFLRVGLRDETAVLPALARWEIPSQVTEPTCDGNLPPVATIVGQDGGARAFGSPGQLVSILLDGSPSYDPEGLALDDYLWMCGNNYVPQEQLPDGRRAVCQYRVESIPVRYNAALIVKDRGTGEIDPDTGNYRCQRPSPETAIAVTIEPRTAAAAEP